MFPLLIYLFVGTERFTINSTRPFHHGANRVAKSYRELHHNGKKCVRWHVRKVTSHLVRLACLIAGFLRQEEEKEEKIGKDGRLNVIQRLAMYAPKPTGLLLGSGNPYSANRAFSISSIHGEDSVRLERDDTAWEIHRQFYTEHPAYSYQRKRFDSVR